MLHMCNYFHPQLHTEYHICETYMSMKLNTDPCLFKILVHLATIKLALPIPSLQENSDILREKIVGMSSE